MNIFSRFKNNKIKIIKSINFLDMAVQNYEKNVWYEDKVLFLQNQGIVSWLDIIELLLLEI